MRWRSLCAMAADGDRCYTAATRSTLTLVQIAVPTRCDEVAPALFEVAEVGACLVLVIGQYRSGIEASLLTAVTVQTMPLSTVHTSRSSSSALWPPARQRAGIPCASVRSAEGRPGSAAASPRLLDAARLRRVGLPSDTRGPVWQAAHNVVATVTAPIGKLGTGSYPQFVVMVSDATSASGVALNTCFEGLGVNAVKLDWAGHANLG
jgi:hypothetical protein